MKKTGMILLLVVVILATALALWLGGAWRDEILHDQYGYPPREETPFVYTID